MPALPDPVAEARQLLAACGWTLSEHLEGAKPVYVAHDAAGMGRRQFIPPQRLLDYARGVFDAQDFGDE
jgi:hypothetical protein